MPDHPRGTEQAGGSVSSETTETPKSRLQVSPHQWALLAIAAAVLLANLPYLLGIFDPNPLHFRSGLVTAITPGWLGGKPTIDPGYGFTSQAIGHRAALDLLHLHLPFPHRAFFHASIIWGTVTVVAVAAVALVRRTQARAFLLTLIVAVDSIVLFAVPEFAAPRSSKVDLAPVAYLRRHLDDGRFFTLGPIAPITAPTSVSPRSGSMTSRRAPTPRSCTADSTQWFPSRVFGLRGPRRRSTWIYHLAGASPYFGASGCLTTSGARDTARVTCARPSTLVRRETWLAGWSAQIDGRPMTIRRVEGLFQAVTVPAGSHVITFSFTPPGMGWALAGMLAGCALMFVPTVRRRKFSLLLSTKGVR